MKIRVLLNIVLSLVVLAVAGLLVYLLFVHRTRPEQRKGGKVIPKVLAPPIRPRLNYRVEIVGYGSARPRVQLEITPQVGGIVVEKAPNFLSGKYVRKGQVLFRIDRTDYDLSVKRAERRIDLIKAQLSQLVQEQKNLTESRKIESERVELAGEQLKKAVKLLEKNAASENEVDLARETLLVRKSQLQKILNSLALIRSQRRRLDAELASAGAELDQAKVNLDRCTLRSPVTGRVLESRIEVGQTARAGGVCGKIYGTDVMEVPVSVLATDLEWLDPELLELCKHGDLPKNPSRRIKARVEWRRSKNAGPITWVGCVERIEAGLEAKTRTATLVVRVKNPELNNPDGAAVPMLETNMFCKVTIAGRKVPGAYVLPREAILPDGSVYVAVKAAPRIEFLWYGKAKVVIDYRLHKRPVSVARFTNEEAIILPDGGISESDRVVIGPVAKPVIGRKVKPVDRFPSATGGPVAITRPAKKSPSTAPAP